MTTTETTTRPISHVRRWHAGETAYIVGRGPSLLRVSRETFTAPGPVLVLNRALEYVREIPLSEETHPVYSLQKDGCVAHDWKTPRDQVSMFGEHECLADWMVRPTDPETLIISAAESPFCFSTYRRRLIMDVEADFGLPWYTMSAPVAMKVAALMGVGRVVMLGFDSLTHDDTRTVVGESLIDNPHAGYRVAAVHAQELADAADISVEWRK